MIVRSIKVLVVAAGLAAGVAGVIIWTGAYNVAATEPHYAITVSLFSIARDRAIAVRAKEMTPPSGWLERVDLKKGFPSYHDMCVVCHAAPGLKDSVVRMGLNPKPPRLMEHRVQQRTDAELFWIIKHGIKMSGMPAFGPTHTDQEIWEVAAFLRQLASMQPTDYQELLEQEEWPAQFAPSAHDHRPEASQ